jgi:hypothetical protein
MFSILTLVLDKSKDVSPEPSIRKVVRAGGKVTVVNPVHLKISNVVHLELDGIFKFLKLVHRRAVRKVHDGGKLIVVKPVLPSNRRKLSFVEEFKFKELKLGGILSNLIKLDPVVRLDGPINPPKSILDTFGSVKFGFSELNPRDISFNAIG